MRKRKPDPELHRAHSRTHYWKQKALGKTRRRATPVEKDSREELLLELVRVLVKVLEK